ncbi:hypothetical protein F3Y22_tig00002237pilonHSYRG00184 [Hibiscus syriacus]|uniref:Uncharacterized protein n=1 Tax=Hibiscus syriacus TaxID=106335 RepID=A0A6A3CSR6_HIBSY|nr:hypothetical protein F3Y22_tig00002237pilonHSYRG00184 [Hibiscus syriacus]
MVAILQSSMFRCWDHSLLACSHKNSHRAQEIASFACRWHALATCSSTDASLGGSNSAGNMEVLNQPNLLHMTFSESDLDSVDFIAMSTTTQLASYMFISQKTSIWYAIYLVSIAFSVYFSYEDLGPMKNNVKLALTP